MKTLTLRIEDDEIEKKLEQIQKIFHEKTANKTIYKLINNYSVMSDSINNKDLKISELEMKILEIEKTLKNYFLAELNLNKLKSLIDDDNE